MPEAKGLGQGADGRVRCAWAAASPDYSEYHDREWGRPTLDDRWLFEKICLEGFQSGLSWLTILRKRDNFRRAFSDFDVRRVARFGDRQIEKLLADAGIVRHRGKIASTINNAARALELLEAEGTLARYVWRFEPPPSARPKKLDWATLMTMPKTAESIALSKDLKKRGWSFVGPTTMYAFMQSAGIVNDHVRGVSAGRKWNASAVPSAVRRWSVRHRVSRQHHGDVVLAAVGQGPVNQQAARLLGPGLPSRAHAAISASGTMSVRPSLHSSRRSPSASVSRSISRAAGAGCRPARS